MKNITTPPPTAEGILFVCCTSHMDWDWIASFEDYYNTGLSPHNPVRYTLDQAYSILGSNPTFQYNLVEVAWLQRWLQDNPGKQAGLIGYGTQFYLIGGGITSPDNLVCNGEVFIRNFLVGRQYLKSLGFSDQISNVCCIPDDFGQDPELPVVMKAMGFDSAAFWRVPGDEPGTANEPTDGSPSIYTQLIENGVIFNWQASDGTQVKGLLFADGYGVPFYVSQTDSFSTAEQLNTFVQRGLSNCKSSPESPCYKWPSSNQFVLSGGDYSTPSTNLLDGINLYNHQDFPQTKIHAQFGSFEDYFATLPQLNAQTLNPSNFWTGHFASRPELKILHNRATRLLLAAETATSILQVYSKYSRASLSSIDRLIQSGWESLVPSSHHDYINGTSPDNTYWSEQLPLLQTTVETATTAVDQCLSRIAAAITPSTNSGEQAVLVYNDLGFDRSTGTLVEIEVADNSSYQSVRIGSTNYPVQKVGTQGVLFQCPSLGALSYQTVYLSPTTPTVAGNVINTNINNGTVTISNGTLTMVIQQSDKWAISELYYNSEPSQNLVDGLANELILYTDTGNLYQFGNEIDSNGFIPVANSDLAGVALTQAQIDNIENGPLRWSIEVKVQSVSLDVPYFIRYELYANEPVVRMSVTGAAASNGQSALVTSFSMVDGNCNATNGMQYGTANHWHTMDYVPYWTGPTFRSTHNYALLTVNGTPNAAIYQQGTPAWALEGNQLLGVLLRNADGMQRGAAGTDPSVHTQQYALRLPGVDGPASGQPLQEAYSVQAAPFACLIEENPISVVVNMGESVQLASVGASDAVIRMARTQAGSGSSPTQSYPNYSNNGNPLSLIFRIYQGSNNLHQSLSLQLPFTSTDQPLTTVECLTALEETGDNTFGTASTSGSTVNIHQAPTITTLRVQTKRPYLMPDNGKM